MIPKRIRWLSLFLSLFFFKEHRVEGQAPSTGSSSKGWLSPCGGFFRKDSELAKIGFELQQQKKYAEAIDCFTKAINKKPELLYYRLRGNCYLEWKRLPSAIDDFREVVKKDPKNKKDRLLLSQLLFDFESFDEAVNEAIIVGDVDEVAKLGDKLLSLGESREAVRCYSHAIGKNPSNTQYYRQRGKCHLESGNWPEAVEDFRQVLKIGPYDKNDQISLIQSLLNTERFQEAVNETIFLNDNEELIKLGDKLSYEREYDEALRCYTKAIENSPNEARLYKLRGKCYKKMNTLDSAIFDFYELVKIDPRPEHRKLLREMILDFEELNEAVIETLSVFKDTDLQILGEDFFVSKKFEQALFCFTKAIEKNPAESENYKWRGRCYARMGNMDRAISEFQKAVEMNPHNHDNQVVLREALLSFEKFNEILVGTLVLLNDSQLEILATNFILREKFEEGLRCLNQIIERNSSEVRYYRQRGNCYKKMQNLEMAISDFYKMLELGSSDMGDRRLLKDTLFHFERFNELPDETIFVLTDSDLETLGHEFFYARKFEEALRCFTMAIEKNPSQTRYVKQRGDCFWEMKNSIMAISNYRQMVQMDPLDKRNQAILREALFQSGFFDELIEDALLLSDIELIRLGDKFYSNRHFEEAIRCYTEAINKYDVESAYYRKRGFCYWRMENLHMAVNDFEKAVQIKPSSVKYWLLYIEALSEDERFEEAKNALTQFEETGDSAQHQEEAHQLVERVMEKKRLTDSTAHLKKLILDDTMRRIDEIREDEFYALTSEELENKIRKLELDRDNYIQELTQDFVWYTSQLCGRSFSPFTQEPSSIEFPDYLVDKITYELMSNPVITPNGITYDREEIVKHIRHHRKDPMTRQNLEERQLIPNRALKAAIESWKKINLSSSDL